MTTRERITTLMVTVWRRLRDDPDLVKPEIRRRTPQQRNDGRIDAPGATGGQAR